MNRCGRGVLNVWPILMLVCSFASPALAGNVGTGDILDGAVTTAKIADGAIVDSKISGQISSSKISREGLDSETVDGFHADEFAAKAHQHQAAEIADMAGILSLKSDVNHTHSGFQKIYSNVVVVAKSGGDYSNIQAAINSITGASETNPYLVKIMPGTYNISTESITTKPYVNIEGSGANLTKIVAVASGTTMTIVPKSNLSRVGLEVTYNSPRAIRLEGGLKEVFVKAHVGVSGCIGITVPGTAEAASIEDVEVFVDGSMFSPSYGVLNYSKNLTMKNVKVTALESYNADNYNPIDVYGVYSTESINIIDCSVKVLNTDTNGRAIGVYEKHTDKRRWHNLEVDSNGTGVKGNNLVGVYPEEFFQITSSNIKGKVYSIDTESSTGLGRYFISDTQLSGPLNTNAVYICNGVYDENYNPIACQQ